MKQITVRYFAQFADDAGRESEIVSTNSEQVTGIVDFVRSKYPDMRWDAHTRFVVNDEFVPPDHALSDGDELLLFPPFTGG